MKRQTDIKESFHNKHEAFSQKAYETSGILPDRYVLILTNLCNLKCSFCYQKRDPRKDAMTAKDWIDLAKQFPDYARVTLCGGEPLAFPKFKDVFSFIAERFDCNLISNGILLTKEMIDYLLAFPKFKVLSLSIDDVGDKLRGVTPKQWEHLVSMLKYFVKKRDELNSECMLDIKTMVLDENAKDLFKTYKYFVEELKIDTYAFQFLKGSPIQHSDIMYEIDDIVRTTKAHVYKDFQAIKEQLELVRQYNVANHKVSFIHPKVDSLTSKKKLSNIDVLNDPKYMKSKYLPCKFPWSSIHVNVDGTLFPCLAVAMGNVKKESLAKIINGEKFARFRDIIRKEGTVEACNRCGWMRPAKETK
jgi:MoaA/NifB/PqqE/SkfB family radical SAM enzyme